VIVGDECQTAESSDHDPPGECRGGIIHHSLHLQRHLMMDTWPSLFVVSSVTDIAAVWYFSTNVIEE
jgi:hypothetical protein